MWFAARKDLVNLKYSGQNIGRKLNTNEYFEVLKGSGDFCKIPETFLGRNALLIYGPLLEKYGNITLGCPILKGSYYVDFPVSEVKVFPFIPVFDKEFNLTGSLKTQTSRKKISKIFDLVVIGSTKFE